jgi:putative ABC transport system permease protein
VKYSQNLILSCEILAARKLRTLLSITGIVVGVGAMVVTVSVGRGAERHLARTIGRMGTNLIVVNAGQTQIVAGRQRQAETVTTLNARDARAISENCLAVEAVTPIVRDRVSAVWETENTNTTLLGMSPAGFVIRDFSLASGYFFDQEQSRASRRLAVIGPTVAGNLFPGVDPLGQRFRINRVPFEVIGVTEAKGTDFNGLDLDDVIIVPLQTASRRLLNVPYVHSIYVQARDQGSLSSAEDEISGLLRSRHRLGTEEDDFTIQNQATLLAAGRETSRLLTLLTGSVVGISMLVGGVGILAVMLIAVRERTGEIGLRRALGADRKVIRTQFLTESVLLSISGGVLGVTAGLGAAMGMSLLGLWEAVISWPAVCFGFVFSVALGIVFGIYPAMRAARLEPNDALRAL